ncbi:MAG: GAF domain-containing protein [Caldimonas sp.]
MTQKDDEREAARQAALDALAVDRFADTAVNDIARMAADLCGTPIALVSMVDGDKQWFKARVGLATTETSREWAFCAHAIQAPGQVFVVEDATLDPRFADNPLVTGDPHIRFYAGAPLVTSSGHALGTVCVIDTQPRTLDPERMESLRFLAQQVVTRLEDKQKK